jgi:hypothetical protein
MNILEAQRKIVNHEKKIIELKKKAEEEITLEKEELEKTRNHLNLLFLNIDTDKYARAEKLIYISYEGNRINPDLVNLAVSDVLSGAKNLKTEYYGMKRYAGYFQESHHRYGCGPRHGTVVQSIGLKGENTNREYTDQEIEDMLYMLICVKATGFVNPIQKEIDCYVGKNTG